MQRAGPLAPLLMALLAKDPRTAHPVRNSGPKWRIWLPPARPHPPRSSL